MSHVNLLRLSSALEVDSDTGGLATAVFDGARESPITPNSVFIKGFASVAILDRSNEYVDPREFDVATFMASPTLLENHKFLFDEFGNETVAGRVDFMEAAFISRLAEDPEFWIISSLIDGREINTILRSKVPNLHEGDKGLFIVAEVTHPNSIRKVLSGEIGGLSWMGYVTSMEDAGGATILRQIDLAEVSIVNVPGNSQATFMIGKSLKTGLKVYEQPSDNVGVFRMRFGKNRYTQDRMFDYLKRHKMPVKRVSEDQKHWFVDISDSERYQVAKSFAVRVGDASAILAPMIEKNDDEVLAEFIGDIKLEEVKMPDQSAKAVQRLFLVDEAVLTGRIPGCKIQVQKSVVTDDMELEICTLEIPETPEIPDSLGDGGSVENTSQTDVTVPEDVETVVGEVSENSEPSEEASQILGVLAKLASDLDVLKKGYDELKEGVRKAKSVEVPSELNALLNSLKAITPPAVPRREKIKIEKSVNTENTEVAGPRLADALPF